jgi:hypothetical protein
MALPSLPLISGHREQLQDLLMTHADALISRSPDLEILLAPYDQEIRDQVEDLLVLADRISRSLIQVHPSEQFVTRLRQQLILADANLLGHQTWWGRIRQLPPRTQLAAGIGGATLTAGVVLIASRTLPEVWNLWRSRRTLIV